MRVIADLHIHSQYARACSKQLTIKNLATYGAMKGLGLIGTGDFQHPKYSLEIKKDLQEDGTGILRTENSFPFLLQTELSLMYSQGGKGRRIHLVVLAPEIAVTSQITEQLLKWGRIDYDGRPIFNKSCIEFVDAMRTISKEIEVIPAHAWTPYFGIFGSKSGFDSVKECFGDNSKHVHAVETGISSDPEMNRRLSQLDNMQVISGSDCHSVWPWRLGREATVFDLKHLTYGEVIQAIRTGEGLESTIEFFPEEGRYHFDGHKNCGINISPEESRKLKGICPKCRKPLTLGVLNRVEELADRKGKYSGKPFVTVVPLSEIISSVLKKGILTKDVWKAYMDLINKFGNEFAVLLDTQYEELLKITDKTIADVIIAGRKGKLRFTPGYDGEYGHLLLDEFGIQAKHQEVVQVPKVQKGLDEY